MSRTLTTWSLLLCLLASSAYGQSNEVKRFLNAAVTLYENLEYEKALKQLQKARAKATGPDDEMKISLLEGVVLADLGKEDRALTAFKTAFGFDLEAKMPVEVSPKVAVIAEKARANVRKLLAPQLEREKRETDEKKRAEAQAAALAEQKRHDDEQALKNQPPPIRLEAVKATASPKAGLRAGAWVAGGVGLACAGGATFFLLGASTRYQALTGRTAASSEAAAMRDEGKLFATLGYAFTGVAVAGLATSAVLFFLAGRPEAPPKVVVTVAPMPSGGFVGLQGAF